jgi:hypothetical protein
MESAKKNKPLPVFLLYFLVASTGISALYGGLNLILDPSGEGMQLPLSLLKNSYFKDYLIPGIILFTFVGMFSVVALVGLIGLVKWRLPNYINIFKEQEWGWTFSLYLGIILTIWLEVQLMVIGFHLLLQVIIAAVGILMIAIPLIPSVKNHFLIPIEKRLYKSILKEYKTAIKYKDLVS